MKISALEDYSVRCLSQLARYPGERLTIARIAEAEGLSEENAAKILARLRDAGLIRSFRGKDGGYVLARPATLISIAETLGAIGGGLFETEERCHGGSDDPGCVHQGDCGIRPVWLTLGRVINEFLSSITLDDLIHSENRVCARLDTLVESLDVPNGIGGGELKPLTMSGRGATHGTDAPGSVPSPGSTGRR